MSFLITNIEGFFHPLFFCSNIIYLFYSIYIYFIYFYKDAKYLASALPKQIFSADIIFIPVNNKQSLESFIGGSHWSLLIYVKQNNKFLYYDSANNMNSYIAYKFADKISGVLEVKSRY